MLWLVALGALCNVLMVATGYGMTYGKARQERAFSMLNLSGYNIGTFAMPFVAGFLPPTGFLATCLFDAGNAIMCTGGTYSPTALPTPHSIYPSRVSCATSFRPSLSASI